MKSDKHYGGVIIMKICLYCGKEFEGRSSQIYCSNSCRIDYHNKRRLKEKHCLQCGDELALERKKFCNSECMDIYYIEKPKYNKVCVQCGKEFKTNNRVMKVCSKECQSKLEQERRLKVTQRQFKKKFETNHPNFIYIDGYVNYSSTIRIKCKSCGEVFDRTAQLGSPSKGRIEIQCNGCIAIRQTKASLLNILLRRHNTLIREQDRIIKEEEKEAHRLQRLEQLKDRVCKECGKVFDAVRERQPYCSDVCSRKYNNRVKEVNKRWRLIDNGGVGWDISLSKLIKRDNNTCHICNGKCNKKDYIKNGQGHFIVGKDYPSIDHVTPVSKGGTHTWDNIKLAHHYCNFIKSDKEVYEEGNGQLIIAI